MTALAAFLTLLFGLFAASPAPAHETRPAYLEIKQTDTDMFDLLWKTPKRGNAIMKLNVILPDTCNDTRPPLIAADAAAQVLRRTVQCVGGLSGRDIRINGLRRTLVETIVRVKSLERDAQTMRLMSGTDTFTVAGPSSLFQVAVAYGLLGIEHILSGFDHLCFVLALMLLIDNLRRLVWSITAFTLAHSMTLAAATLGYASAPPGLIEALIALSIAIVAAEVIWVQRGLLDKQDRPRRGAGNSWVIAFSFGLLHGFGFAGALSATGLPSDAIPTALLFFNIGVELGQLTFVASILALGFLIGRLSPFLLNPARLAATYGIGILAAFWTIQRTVSMVM